MASNNAIIGTELKFNLYFEPIGAIKASSYDFSIKVYCNNSANIVIPKNKCVPVDDDNFLVMVDTTTLGLGRLTVEVTAYIPDEDFDDGLRTEIARYITDVNVIS